MRKAPPRSRYDPPARAMRLVNPSRYHDLLRLVGRLGLVTSDQINRCIHKRTRLSQTTEDCFELFQSWHLGRETFHVHRLGQPRVAHKLRNRGYRLLRALGMEAEELIRPSDSQTVSEHRILHTILSNEPIIMAIELARLYPWLHLRFESEPLLRRRPLILGYGSGNVLVIPDAFVRILRLKGPGEPPGEAAFCFELDRGTMPIKTDLPKRLRNYLQAATSEAYVERFGTRILRVVWVVEGDEKRRDQLLSATWQHLKEVRQEGKAPLFLFGTWDEQVGCEDFYFNPTRWLMPDGQTSALLPLSWRSDG